MEKQLKLTDIDEFNLTVTDSLSFTKKSEELFYDTVDLKDFQDKDAETIFQCLMNNIRLVPFGDYLKRYIYLKSSMNGDFKTIGIHEYQHIIIDSFAENYTPKSFTDTTAKLSALAKNWLTQATVNRSVVFLLGFGLNMDVNDVSDFLTKALRERDFDFKNPQEVIYWYCYRNKYKYPKMMKLKKQLEDIPPQADSSIYDNKTINVRDNISIIGSDDELLGYLSGMKNDDEKHNHSVTVKTWFNDLYAKCKCIVADFYNKDEQEINTGKVWTANDITEGDIEKVLCCGMPVNNSGNLVKLSASQLAGYFENKRFSRQHIADLLSGNVAVDRFDLITMNFFIFSQDETYTDNKLRYIEFVDDMNYILSECMMGELYITNPYECFLLMCIVSDCPLATYADVWEMSFESKNNEMRETK